MICLSRRRRRKPQCSFNFLNGARKFGPRETATIRTVKFPRCLRPTCPHSPRIRRSRGLTEYPNSGTIRTISRLLSSVRGEATTINMKLKFRFLHKRKCRTLHSGRPYKRDLLHTGLGKSSILRLRELDAAARGGITQPRNRTFI